MKKIKNIIGSFLEKKCQIVLFFGMLALGVNAQDLEKLYITVNPPGSIKRQQLISTQISMLSF